MNTKIYALTDSHQETRNLSTLFSYIYEQEKDNTEPFLILDSGDLFKGIYDKKLSISSYLKLKELLPQSNIFIELGNNDFGFNKSDFKYLKDTINTFKNNNINIICANLKDKNGYADFVDRYKIVNLNGQRIFITGFCINNSCAKKFGYELVEPVKCYNNLLNSITQDYDKIIVLNHNWINPSINFYDEVSQEKIFKQIDLILGGHEHSKKGPDTIRNIYYPLAFAKSVDIFEIKKNKIEFIKEIKVQDIKINPIFEKPLIEYEQETQLYKPLVKRVLNLTKMYSEPSCLGTFISDYMKKFGNSDIAFHSTGFCMNPLNLDNSKVITKYDFEKVICAATPIENVKLKAGQLKTIFEHALKNKIYKNQGNAQFLQCSKNITIIGKIDYENKCYNISQIKIDDKDLLDKNAQPIDDKKEYLCTIDSYIGSGEQGFTILKDIEKEPILFDNEELKINKVLYLGLLDVEQKDIKDTQYPTFKLIDLE